jgi:hypothetical protein
MLAPQSTIKRGKIPSGTLYSSAKKIWKHVITSGPKLLNEIGCCMPGIFRFDSFSIKNFDSNKNFNESIPNLLYKDKK